MPAPTAGSGTVAAVEAWFEDTTSGYMCYPYGRAGKGNQHAAQMVTNAGTWLMIFNENGVDTVYFSYSTDQGSTWSSVATAGFPWLAGTPAPIYSFQAIFDPRNDILVLSAGDTTEDTALMVASWDEATKTFTWRDELTVDVGVTSAYQGHHLRLYYNENDADMIGVGIQYDDDGVSNDPIVTIDNVTTPAGIIMSTAANQGFGGEEVPYGWHIMQAKAHTWDPATTLSNYHSPYGLGVGNGDTVMALWMRDTRKARWNYTGTMAITASQFNPLVGGTEYEESTTQIAGNMETYEYGYIASTDEYFYVGVEASGSNVHPEIYTHAASSGLSVGADWTLEKDYSTDSEWPKVEGQIGSSSNGMFKFVYDPFNEVLVSLAIVDDAGGDASLFVTEYDFATGSITTTDYGTFAEAELQKSNCAMAAATFVDHTTETFCVYALFHFVDSGGGRWAGYREVYRSGTAGAFSGWGIPMGIA